MQTIVQSHLPGMYEIESLGSYIKGYISNINANSPFLGLNMYVCMGALLLDKGFQLPLECQITDGLVLGVFILPIRFIQGHNPIDSSRVNV